MRGQSHVVGVALLLGIALVGIGTLTVGIGTVVESQAATADAGRVADGFESLADAADQTGAASQQLAFADGQLRAEQRTVRVLRDGAVVERETVDVLVFESGDQRVTFHSGAVVQTSGGSSWLRVPPQVTGSERNGVLVVGAVAPEAGHVAVGGSGQVRTRLRIRPTHTRRDLGTGTYAVAVETDQPGAFERHFEETGVRTTRRTFADDDTASVVAHFAGTRQGYFVRHNLSLEVAG